MRIPWTLTQLFFASVLLANSPNGACYEKTGQGENQPFQEATLRGRLLEMDCIIKPIYTKEVAAYLKSYLSYGFKDSEQLLGKSVLYFPIFEHYLQLYDLPEELKYLPMIESRLRPYAVSTAGAAGLWQFMPRTARQYGLKINSYVDERKDPYRSSEAAVKHLAKLYKRFGSWELALAAYNCGSTKMSSVIRLAHTTDFWKLRKYLPRETRSYVPRLIAATYFATYYRLYGLKPVYPDFEQQWTRTTLVFHSVSFREISKTTGASVNSIRQLNPGYKRSFIPTNPEGYFLVLPEPAMQAFRERQNSKYGTKFAAAGQPPSEDYFKSNYVVLAGDSIESLARLYNCSVENILRWNNLHSRELLYRQELVLYHLKKGNRKERA